MSPRAYVHYSRDSILRDDESGKKGPLRIETLERNDRQPVFSDYHNHHERKKRLFRGKICSFYPPTGGDRRNLLLSLGFKPLSVIAERTVIKKSVTLNDRFKKERGRSKDRKDVMRIVRESLQSRPDHRAGLPTIDQPARGLRQYFQ